MAQTWCSYIVWSVRPSSPLRLPHLKCLLCYVMLHLPSLHHERRTVKEIGSLQCGHPPSEHEQYVLPHQITTSSTSTSLFNSSTISFQKGWPRLPYPSPCFCGLLAPPPSCIPPPPRPPPKAHPPTHINMPLHRGPVMRRIDLFLSDTFLSCFPNCMETFNGMPSQFFNAAS